MKKTLGKKTLDLAHQEKLVLGMKIQALEETLEKETLERKTTLDLVHQEKLVLGMKI